MSVPVAKQLEAVTNTIESATNAKVLRKMLTEAETHVDASAKASRESQLLAILKPVLLVLKGKDEGAKSALLRKYGVEPEPVEPEPVKKSKKSAEPEVKAEPVKKAAKKNGAVPKDVASCVVRKPSGEIERKATIFGLMRLAQTEMKERVRFDAPTVRVLLEKAGVSEEVDDGQIRVSLANLSIALPNQVARILREDRGVFILNPTWKPAK